MLHDHDVEEFLRIVARALRRSLTRDGPSEEVKPREDEHETRKCRAAGGEKRARRPRGPGNPTKVTSPYPPRRRRKGEIGG